MTSYYLDSARKKRTQQVRNERDVTTYITEIKKNLRDYYEQYYANKLDNLEKIGKFLETCNLQRLNQDEIENMKRWITRTLN